MRLTRGRAGVRHADPQAAAFQSCVARGILDERKGLFQKPNDLVA